MTDLILKSSEARRALSTDRVSRALSLIIMSIWKKYKQSTFTHLYPTYSFVFSHLSLIDGKQ